MTHGVQAGGQTIVSGSQAERQHVLWAKSGGPKLAVVGAQRAAHSLVTAALGDAPENGSLALVHTGMEEVDAPGANTRKVSGLPEHGSLEHPPPALAASPRVAAAMNLLKSMAPSRGPCQSE